MNEQPQHLPNFWWSVYVAVMAVERLSEQTHISLYLASTNTFKGFIFANSCTKMHLPNVPNRINPDQMSLRGFVSLALNSCSCLCATLHHPPVDTGLTRS